MNRDLSCPIHAVMLEMAALRQIINGYSSCLFFFFTELPFSTPFFISLSLSVFIFVFVLHVPCQWRIQSVNGRILNPVKSTVIGRAG
jgi:hypothetical protein